MASAIVISAGAAGVLAQLPPVGVCGTGPGQLNCFDPLAAGEMWRSIDPILERTSPDILHDENGDPVLDEDGRFVGENAESLFELNEFGDEIWVSTADTLEEALDLLEPGECAFSHLGDPLDATRLCKDDDGTIVPPPTGQLLYPAGVAVFGERIYVADRMNHRVQVVDFDGNPLAIDRPMGNGEPGTGPYDVLYPGQTLSGSRLNAPSGLAVDAAGRVLVADGGNGRIAIFDGATGAVAFGSEASPVHMAIPPGVSGSEEVTPTTVAVSPGAVLVTPGDPPQPGDENARIVVLDRVTCTMQVFDTGFNALWQYPPEKPLLSASETSCVSNEASNAVGLFSIMTGATVDPSGRIYVVDSWNNRVQVFTKDGAVLGAFGAPPSLDEEPPLEALETPSSVLIDHNGRVVVNDSDNLRMAFFDVTFGAGGPVAQFLFEVPAEGDDVEEFPTGLAEQVGSLEDGLDPAGRYLKVDTAGQRLQRLELADLAIVQASAKDGEGFFSVAVPSEKAGAVFGVSANVVPADLNEDGDFTNDFDGVGILTIEPLAPGTGNDDIYPGMWVKYRFTYEDPNELPEVVFTITADGNNASAQATEAPPVDVTVRGDCEECDAALEVRLQASPSTPATSTSTATGDWYREPVFARLTPAGANPSEVTHIEWFVTGSDLVQHGNGVHRSLLPAGARWVDVPFSGKSSDLTYWAVTADNTVGPEHTQNVKVDLDGPVVVFDFFAADGVTLQTPSSGVNPADGPGGTVWWNTDVDFSYSVSDDYSGTDATGGDETVTGQGRNLATQVTAVDRVLHSTLSPSNDLEHGGRIINIDTEGPAMTPPADLLLIADVDGVAEVPASFINGATAIDNLSGVNGAITATGPATVDRGETVTWEFTATDWAGNTSTVTADVSATGSSLVYTGRPIVQYGLDLAVSAFIEPTGAAGSVRFTLVDPVRGNREISGVLAAGVAAAEIDEVLNNVGTFTLRVEYVGTDLPPTAIEVDVEVTPTPFSVDVTPGQSKRYGAPDPDEFSYHLPAPDPLHPEDVITGRLEREAGENVGDDYVIGQGSFDINANYTIVVHSEPFAITAATVNLRADDHMRVYGEANPSLTVTVTGELGADPLNYTTATAATGTTGIGGYPITITLGLNPNYDLSPENGTLTIDLRPVTVQADNLLKLINLLDPPLTFQVIDDPLVAHDGVVNGDQFSGALVRAAGETVGQYPITQGTLSLGANYDLQVLQGIFEIFSILPGNHAPVALDDSATGVGAAPVTIAVLSNDSDPDGDALAVSAVTQPANGEGTVTTSGNLVTFAPTPGFAGVATFTYTITDNKGGFATATVTVTITASTCSLDGFVTFTQGGWGSKPHGHNPGQFLKTHFETVYPDGFVRIGGHRTLTFTSAKAIERFLPQGGRPRVLNSNATNPRRSSAGVFGGQVLALQLNVDFSRAGITKAGLGELLYDGQYPVSQILAVANLVLGGQTGALAQLGLSRVSQLNDMVDAINNNFTEGNNGDLTCPSGGANQPPVVAAADQSHDEGAAVSYAVSGSDPDADDDLTFSASGLPPGLAIHPSTGVISGTLSYDSAGSYDVTVTVSDESGATATAEFVWTVANTNRPPTAVNDTLKTSKNRPKTMSVIANDSDPDGDDLTVTSVTQPGKGSVVKYSNGTIKYTPKPNWIGTTSFSYTISDGKGGTDTATVSVTVGSHRDDDDCDRDHDRDGDCDRDDDRERDCDRDHRHNDDCDRDRDKGRDNDHNHDRDCDRDHSRSRNCNDNRGWYNWRYR